MPIIPGTMGIKSWSYEMLIPQDSGAELCEDCHNLAWPLPIRAPEGEPANDVHATKYNGYNHYYTYETPTGETKITCNCAPIFADTEMDRTSVCANCEYESDLHTVID